MTDEKHWALTYLENTLGKDRVFFGTREEMQKLVNESEPDPEKHYCYINGIGRLISFQKTTGWRMEDGSISDQAVTTWQDWG
jgi:hypothetical protein